MIITKTRTDPRTGKDYYYKKLYNWRWERFQLCTDCGRSMIGADKLSGCDRCYSCIGKNTL